MSTSNESSSSIAADVLAGYLTPDELAASLQISRRTLARTHARREGPPRCKVGKLILYRLEAVRDWLAGLETEPPKRDRRRR